MTDKKQDINAEIAQIERIKAELADSYDEELELELDSDNFDELVAEQHEAWGPGLGLCHVA